MQMTLSDADDIKGLTLVVNATASKARARAQPKQCGTTTSSAARTLGTADAACLCPRGEHEP
jgi:hypothetical protein